MSQFLNHMELHDQFETMIRNAEKDIIIITPVLKLNRKIQQLLEIKNKSNLRICIVHALSRLNSAQVAFLEHLKNVHNNVYPQLHASLYLSEKECIIGGLNLHEFYTQEKGAVGVLLNSKRDLASYQSAYNESQKIIKSSTHVTITYVRTFAQ